ncbi:hypothetical protein C0966_17210 (plasmid) [Bacillus methanolicus]|uniref:hypothetical protein n=1 Tax=Bacillus methanolicus TaxID=1471 RepID=UPI0023801F5D|nr:hypothetical protein [Bacillus methanolicus]MDE3841005.1 hypothetical protein [Bacillus methanolicus]
MVTEFLNEFLKKKSGKKGYQIIGKGRFIYGFLLLVILIALMISSTYFENIISILFTPIVFYLLYRVNKKIDLKINEANKTYHRKTKEDIRYWIKNNQGFNHSSQYKEFANLLQIEADKKKLTYNLNTLVTLFTPIWSAVVILIVREHPEGLYIVMFYALIFTVVALNTGMALKSILSIFLMLSMKE